MRADEELVKNAVLSYLGDPDAIAEPGEDPPDYYIHAAGSTSALEVTRLCPVYDCADGAIGNRTQVEEALFRLIDDLDQHLRRRIGPRRSLLLEITGPVANLPRFRRKLRLLLEDGLRSQSFLNGRKEFTVCGEQVAAQLVAQSIPESEGVFGIVDSKGDILNVREHAHLILQHALIAKEKIYSALPQSHPFWLALLNQYPLASASTYRGIVSSIPQLSVFDRLFLVGADGSADEIWSKNRQSE